MTNYELINNTLKYSYKTSDLVLTEIQKYGILGILNMSIGILFLSYCLLLVFRLKERINFFLFIIITFVFNVLLYQMYVIKDFYILKNNINLSTIIPSIFLLLSLYVLIIEYKKEKEIEIKINI